MVVIWKLALYSLTMAGLIFSYTHNLMTQMESDLPKNMLLSIFYMCWIGVLDYCILFVDRLPMNIRLFVLIPLSTTLCFRIVYVVLLCS